ncbi:MAG: DUF1801 domain-containing protein [Candidatus Acidiferrales bacterium]
MAAKRKASAGKKSASRAATGQAAAKAFAACMRRGSAELQCVANELRRLVKKTVPGSRETVNPWGIPTFDFHGPICLLMVGKNHVTFGFTRGTSLSDPAGLLEGTGKNLRHVKLREARQVRDANLRRLIREAAALNRRTPLTPSMRVR